MLCVCIKCESTGLLSNVVSTLLLLIYNHKARYCEVREGINFKFQLEFLIHFSFLKINNDVRVSINSVSPYRTSHEQSDATTLDLYYSQDFHHQWLY